MAIPTVGQTLVFKRGSSRLFETAWLFVHVTDLLTTAAFAANGKYPQTENSVFYLLCNVARQAIAIPIFEPMRATVNNIPIGEIKLDVITPEEMNLIEPREKAHVVNEFGQLHNRLVSMVYLQFYEAHAPYINSKYGSDAKQWPSIFQFAWAVRNGIVHHKGSVNFTNPHFPPVHWHTITFSQSDIGKPIFEENTFADGDLLLFLCDLSDHLDAIGAPMPV